MTDLFRRDADIQPNPGTIIAEFSCGSDALHFARWKGADFTVTPGIDKPYAVRVKCYPILESVGYPLTPDAVLQAHPDSVRPAGGFSLTALTPAGKAKLPEIQQMLARLLLPHGGGDSL